MIWFLRDLWRRSSNTFYYIQIIEIQGGVMQDANVK